MCGLSTENTSAMQIKLIRKYLKLRIVEDNVSFRGFSQEREHVYDLFKRTIVNGESHSALMIGPRGSGKTTLINSVLHQLSKEVDVTNDAIIIRLNGLVHYDDKTALKSITAQLQLDNSLEDMAGTFAERLAWLLSCLQTAGRRSRSIVLLLDEFHAFCRTGRPQTLLYNWFDITHSGQAPMLVLGITNRIDVMELLEKRVKSRFSHRHIQLFPTERRDILQTMVELLRVVEKREESKSRSRRNTATQEPVFQTLPDVTLQHCKVATDQTLDPGYVEDWNCHIKALAEDERVINSLEKFEYYVVNEQIFRNVLFELVSKLSPKKPYIDATDLSTIIDKTVAPEHRVKLLQSLSILELSLVIAMKHGMEIFDGQPMNFEMVLHRYTKFANTNSSTQTVPRPVILKAFEHLQELEVISAVKSADSNTADAASSRVQKEYKLYTLAVPLEDLREAVKGFKALPTEISHWFHNSVV